VFMGPIFPHPSDRLLRDHSFSPFRGTTGEPLHHRGLDDPRAHGSDTDVLRGVVAGRRLGQTDHAMLRGRVRGLTLEAFDPSPRLSTRARRVAPGNRRSAPPSKFAILTARRGTVSMPAPLRADILATACVRAVLLGRHDVTRELAPYLGRVRPALAEVLREYVDAPDPEAAAFAAALAILRRPDLGPFVLPGIGVVVLRTLDRRAERWCPRILSAGSLSPHQPRSPSRSAFSARVSVRRRAQTRPRCALARLSSGAST